MGEWDRERGGKGQTISSINGRWKIYRGEVKNSIGNVEAKELICTTHGYELKGGMQVRGDMQGRGE